MFDGHPDLTTIPIESHYFQHAGYHIDYRFRRQRPIAEDRIDFFASAHRLLNAYSEQHEYTPFSDFRSPEKINIDRFNLFAKKIHATKSGRELFDVYMGALMAVFGQVSKSTETRICEKSVENAEFAAELCKMFPRAYFIHIVRNPYDNLSSFRRYRQKVEGKYPMLGPLLESLDNNYYFLAKNSAVYDRYITVRYEDLIDSRAQTMRVLAKKVNLTFRDSLLEPTSLGDTWSSNTTVAKAPERQDITSLEIYFVNKLFSEVVNSFNYPKRKRSGSVWRPSSNEGPKNYLINRVSRYLFR